MKYGQTLQQQSVRQWTPHNIDYNELKHHIKSFTTRTEGRALAIPGQSDIGLQEFEESFFRELVLQHDRVELFVKDKSEEITRRLQHFNTVVLKLADRYNGVKGSNKIARRQEKFSKAESQILRCGEDIQSLDKFIELQRTGFRKILKKYKRWSGSGELTDRFNKEVLTPKSFCRRSFEPLTERYNNVYAKFREKSPASNSADTTPSGSERRQPQRAQPQMQEVAQRSWNEYDDGSEAGDNEPYTIYVDSNNSSFPGCEIMRNALGKLTASIRGASQKLQSIFSPNQSALERRPLLPQHNGHANIYTHSNNTETDFETDADGDDSSSTDFPSGYAVHYATFPSMEDQRLSAYQETVLFLGSIACYITSLILLFIASILMATGRHKLRIEVDLGVVIAVVTSIFFAILGLASMSYRERKGSLSIILASIMFVVICLVNGGLLVFVVGNTV